MDSECESEGIDLIITQSEADGSDLSSDKIYLEFLKKRNADFLVRF